MYFISLIKKILFKPLFKVLNYIMPDLSLLLRAEIYYWLNYIKNIFCQYESYDSVEPAIFVDVTNITEHDSGSGIQRVTNNIFNGVRQLYANTVPVRDGAKFLLTSNNYLSRMGEHVNNKPKKIVFRKGDILFLLDASWELSSSFYNHIRHAKKNGVLIAGIIHDMFPIQYPELFATNYFINNFRKWHNMLLKECDIIICDSKTTADVVIKYYKSCNFNREKKLDLYYNFLGAEFQNKNGAVRSELVDFVKGEITFLMVGTIEPRKGHKLVLQVFEKLLTEGFKVNLLIIGHAGWNIKYIVADIDHLVKKSNHVLWLDDASDVELQWAYKNCTALISASKDEGYGLPLVEAANYGMPIICSDIPIFREVTQGYANYFYPLDDKSLYKTIVEWIQNDVHPNSRNIKIYTWRESAFAVLKILNKQVKPYEKLQ